MTFLQPCSRKCAASTCICRSLRWRRRSGSTSFLPRAGRFTCRWRRRSLRRASACYGTGSACRGRSSTNAPGLERRFQPGLDDWRIDWLRAHSMSIAPRDNDAHRFPVSVKGVVIRDGNVILVRNERDEWELPGGKLELCETPEQCLAREIVEELRLPVEPESILDSWTYTIIPGVHVLVITFGCFEASRDEAVLSNE